ncbi:MAG: FimB/Mfa2 family fimbrial subunit [Bacteroidales bacterium]
MKRISFYLLTVFILLLQSCTKEERVPCKSELLLRFRYTLNNQNVNLFGEQIKRITVYVFDRNGKYVDSFTDSGNHLTNDYVMHLSLPVGKYSVVVYGGNFTTYSTGELNSLNLLNQTLRKGITDINDFRTELKNRSGTDPFLYPVSTPDDLYAAMTVNVASTYDNKIVTNVDLIKNTKKITVKILGTSNISAPPEVYILAQNGRYGYDNSIDAASGVFKYSPVNTLTQYDYTQAELKILRLMLGQSPMLVVRNSMTHEVIYNENMIDQILSTKKYVSQEDFDRENEFVFEIKINPGGVDVGISVFINGWKIHHINPDVS